MQGREEAGSSRGAREAMPTVFGQLHTGLASQGNTIPPHRPDQNPMEETGVALNRAL